jgi:type I restriction enzyme S subunit
MRCKIGEIAEVTMGQSPKSEYYNNKCIGTPFLQGNRTFGRKYPTFDTYTTVVTKSAKAGDIIMSVRAPVGDLNITPVDICLGRGVCSLRMNNGNQEYLYYLMKYYIPHLLNKESGTVFGSVNRKDILGLEVNVVEYKEQQKIARFLSAIDDKIELNERINDNLDEQARLLFRYWFIDAPESNSWKKGTFSNIIDLMIPGDWGKDTPSGKNTEMVYCIRGADIPEVKAGNKGKMPTRYILPQNYVNKHLIDGDVVVEISGGSPTQSTGRIAAVSQSLLNRYDKGMVCTNFCKALKPRPGYSMFLYYYWQYLYDKNVFFSYENGTTGIKNLDISGFIETEPIVLPPQNLVSKFDSFCQSLFNIIFANGRENEGLAMLRDNLLPQLMTGKLEISGLDL